MCEFQKDEFPEVRLTNREMDMLVDMARGFSHQESADERRISVSTVRNRRGDVYRKLDVNSSGEAVREGIRRGLLKRRHFEVDDNKTKDIDTRGRFGPTATPR